MRIVKRNRIKNHEKNFDYLLTGIKILQGKIFINKRRSPGTIKNVCSKAILLCGVLALVGWSKQPDKAFELTQDDSCCPGNTTNYQADKGAVVRLYGGNIQENQKTSNREKKATSAMHWSFGKMYDLNTCRVEISKPLCVGRSSNEFWYPNIMRFTDGTLAMSIRTGDDRVTEDNGLLIWSKDGGLQWSEPKPYSAQSFSYLPLPSGEFALLPHHMYKAPNGAIGNISIINSKGKIKLLKNGVTVTGFSRPFGRDFVNPQEDVAEVERQGRVSLMFNGIPMRMKDGTYLTTLYAIFQGDKKYTTLLAESQDGFAWHIRSIVASEQRNDIIKLNNSNANEACLSALPDGRLMCIFRHLGNKYGQCWSSDDGLTWSEPVAMKNEGWVEPKLLVLQSKTIVLAGGRPGLNLWFSSNKSGNEWQAINTLEHHNALLPQESINPKGIQNYGGTSSYAGIVEIEPNKFLYVYDRVPDTYKVRSNWKADPKNKDNVREKFSVYIALVSVVNK